MGAARSRLGLVVRSTAIYLAVLLALRVFGKRGWPVHPHDLVLILLLANLQSAGDDRPRHLLTVASSSSPR
jgi:uncharacterized membrane protein YcaP (DUF421 family)